LISPEYFYPQSAFLPDRPRSDRRSGARLLRRYIPSFASTSNTSRNERRFRRVPVRAKRSRGSTASSHMSVHHPNIRRQRRARSRLCVTGRKPAPLVASPCASIRTCRRRLRVNQR